MCLPRKYLAGCLLALHMTLNVMAVDRSDVRLIAENWIARSEVFKASGLRHTVAKVTPVTLNNTSAPECYHVALNPQGYIVVSGDKRIMPVICFSLTGNLNLAESPQNALRAMLSSDLKASYAALTESDGDARLMSSDHNESLDNALNANILEWERLANPSTGPSTLSYTPISILIPPLLKTTWSQWNHYNYLCPPNPSAHVSYNGRCAVGCVAVVAAQLMKYYNWPPYGQGSHEYFDDELTVTGFHSRVFADTYDWDNMLNRYSSYSTYSSNTTMAISELMYEAGVAVEMNYRTNGSAASMRNLSSALNQYFSYTTPNYVKRADNTALYDQRLRDNLFAEHPVPASIPGHAILIDGLSADSNTNYFHVNYGWGGSNDGWYRPSNITGDSLYEALFDVEPQLKPLFENHGATTNLTGDFYCTWALPSKRIADVSRLRIKEGEFAPSNMLDSTDNFNAWDNSLWNISNAGYGGGKCFYINSQYYTTAPLRHLYPLKIGNTTTISFNYKPRLYDDSFNVNISTDKGIHWTQVFTTNDIYKWTWESEIIDISSFDGETVELCFCYTGRGNQYTSGGVWLDNIAISNCSALTWTTQATNIAPSNTSFEITSRSDGMRYYSVEAHDGSAWIPLWKPLKTVSVDVSGDTDNDGMNNGWEYEYFGTPTGAIASADADNDLMSNSDECFAGTNPTDNNSCFEMISTSQINNGQRICWSSVSNKSYALWRCEDLLHGNFTCIASNITATPDVNIHLDTNAPNSNASYYRVEVEE